jgi:hypothetical protein
MSLLEAAASLLAANGILVFIRDLVLLRLQHVGKGH